MRGLIAAMLCVAALPLLPGCTLGPADPRGGIQSDIDASRDRPASSALPGQRAAARNAR
jgi:hypothetical protein